MLIDPKEFLAAILPLIDKIVEQNAGWLGKLAWKALRPLLTDSAVVAKAHAAMSAEAKVV